MVRLSSVIWRGYPLARPLLAQRTRRDPPASQCHDVTSESADDRAGFTKYSFTLPGGDARTAAETPALAEAAGWDGIGHYNIVAEAESPADRIAAAAPAALYAAPAPPGGSTRSGSPGATQRVLAPVKADPPQAMRGTAKPRPVIEPACVPRARLVATARTFCG